MIEILFMYSLEKIKLSFENRRLSIRRDFIDEYDFDDDHQDYYRKFLLMHTDVKNQLYLSDLIDVAGWRNIYDEALCRAYLPFLYELKHYLVKLAVLDYFKCCNDLALLEEIRYQPSLRLLLKERLPLIVKNQVYLNLLLLNIDDDESIVAALKKSLTRTNDWRSIYRTLLNFEDFEQLGKYKEAIFFHIRHLSTTHDYGNGVQELLMGVKVLP